ncbi:MAG: YjbE family putative metal transport protein [Defluviitaleaceae bacterium]|nr:YjbE family putative metal transport protein [Defluviitaleaceae bacterium]
MSELLQVILINLIVSLDNIGIIALASRHLDPKKANTARLVGVWLSLGLKLVFIFLIGHIFAITWLHIRLIGGAMLIYVIYGMFKGNHDSAEEGKKRAGSTFFKAMLIIIIADISMSLDNVIAVLSIVADPVTGDVTAHGLILAFIGLIVSVPLLLIGSEAIIKLINKHKIVFAIATGYLGYIAAHMIFEDALFESLFTILHFPYAFQLSITIGVAVGVACYLTYRGKVVT